MHDLTPDIARLLSVGDAIYPCELLASINGERIAGGYSPATSADVHRSLAKMHERDEIEFCDDTEMWYVKQLREGSNAK